MSLPAARARCCACRERIEPVSLRWTRLLPEDVREDYCQQCWKPALEEGAQSVWKSPVLARTSSRLSRDEAVSRLQAQVGRLELPERERTYLLGLLLLQKRLARVVEVGASDTGEPLWKLRVRGRRALLSMVDLGQTLRLEAVGSEA